MTQRIVLGAASIVVIFGVVMLDAGITVRLTGHSGPIADLLRRGSALPLAILAMVLFGARELDRMIRSKGANPHSRFAWLMIAVLVLSPWLSAAGWFGPKPAYVEGLFWQVVWLAVAFVGVGALTVLRGNPSGSLRDSASTLFMILYLGFAASFALQLRCGRGAPGPTGAWLFLMTLLIIKMSDIGAYLVGSVIGRHKLIPSISPGKSIEGTCGGLLASAMLGMLLASASSHIGWLKTALGPSNSTGPLTSAGLLLSEAARSFSLNDSATGLSTSWRGFVFGLTLSFFGQIGDLFESCFKRDAGTKDSGRVMPKFGGILDLIDSPVLAIPVAWFLLTAVWGVI